MKDTDSGFPIFYAKLRNLPAISMKNEKISYVDFKYLFNKNKIFYENNKKNDFYYKTPSDYYIENDIENKIIKDFKINILSKKYNVFISDREVYDETKKYIEKFETKENLESFIKKYYGIDLKFFQEKYIKSYLLMHKLDLFLKNNKAINKNNINKIETAENKIKNEDINFYTVANEYNINEELKESGGSIGWIEKKELLNAFEELKDIEIKKGLITNILKNNNGYYILKIDNFDDSEKENEFVKVSIIKIPTINLNEYLQKEFNNIRIKKYIR